VGTGAVYSPRSVVLLWLSMMAIGVEVLSLAMAVL
jgi:hypothetical protein